MRSIIATLALLLPPGAAAQPWPTKPVKIVMPFAAGGPVATNPVEDEHA